MTLRTSSEEATIDLGRALGAALKEAALGVTVLLYGDLGTGKTTLARGICDAFGIARVRSPSFTLVNEYHTESSSIIHVDLYRLAPGETEDIGLDEYSEAPCVLLVEWPERRAFDEWQNPPERDVLMVFIEHGDENERVFEMSSRGTGAEKALQKLQEAIADGKIDSGVGLQPALD